MRAATGVAVAIAALLSVFDVSSAQVPIGDFYYFERTDSAAHEDLSSVTTVARENFVTGAGGLTWQCRDGALRVTLTSTYLGRGMRAQVRWRFDDQEPSPPLEWRLRSTGMAVTAPMEIGREFTDRAKKADRVMLQVTDYQLLKHDYTFGLAGLAEGLSHLSCSG
jgi:hypothetical protein